MHNMQQTLKKPLRFLTPVRQHKKQDVAHGMEAMRSSLWLCLLIAISLLWSVNAHTQSMPPTQMIAVGPDGGTFLLDDSLAVTIEPGTFVDERLDVTVEPGTFIGALNRDRFAVTIEPGTFIDDRFAVTIEPGTFIDDVFIEVAMYPAPRFLSKSDPAPATAFSFRVFEVAESGEIGRLVEDPRLNKAVYVTLPILYQPEGGSHIELYSIHPCCDLQQYDDPFKWVIEKPLPIDLYQQTMGYDGRYWFRSYNPGSGWISESGPYALLRLQQHGMFALCGPGTEL